MARPSPASLIAPILLGAGLLLLPAALRAQDTDGDGMPDSYENAFNACLKVNVNDAAVDYDGDGMTSLAEYQYSSSLNPCKADTDKDGLPDGWEYQSRGCGFNPISLSSEILGYTQPGAEIRLTNSGADDFFPSLTWTGSEYGLMYGASLAGGASISFRRLSASGAQIGSELLVAGLDPNQAPAMNSMKWTGSEFGLSWGYDGVSFGRVSAAGTLIDTRLLDPWEGDPTLAWTGSEYGMMMNSAQRGADLCFYRVSAVGNIVGTGECEWESQTTFRGTIFHPLVWTGSQFGAGYVWGDGSTTHLVYFSRISASGEGRIGGDTRITDQSSMVTEHGPSLAWTGTEYGVSWIGVGPYQYFRRLSATGGKVGSKLTVRVNYGYSSLVWSGSEFGLSWEDYGGGKIYFARISPTGTKVGSEFVVTSANAWGRYPSMVWTGSEYGLAWQDKRDGNYELYFTRIRPQYSDKDADGLREDAELSAGANPCEQDTDEDGLQDGAEVNTHGTSPTGWDTDGDFQPDGYEVANATGHDPGQNLNPLNIADGGADFDGDGNNNVHELYNQTSPWAIDPVPDPFANPACYFWAEGDGDGVPGPGDLAVVKDEVASGLPAYASVLPRGVFDTQDVDKDGVPGPGDIAAVGDMVVGVDRPAGYPSTPVSLGVVSAPGGAVEVGDTCHVTVEVVNQALAVTRSGAFAVVFSIDPASTGSAVLLGGEGEDLGQSFTNRYDVSGPSAAGGLANIVLKAISAGTVIVRAKVPACGIGTTGRWSAEVELAPAVVITAE